jgi:riboflavin synthase
MFTGIITDCGTVADITEGAGRRTFRIRTGLDLTQLAIGASVACDGCCLTLVSKDKDSFTVDAVAETLAVTTLGQWAVGTKVNLESSLRLGDEMGGHMVSGHVDALAVVDDVRPDGDSWRFKIRVPEKFAAFIAPKGSVALNGISLTVNEVEGNVFGICIIPHTWQVTNISQLKKGDRINMEIDLLARYVARILGKEAA